MHFSQPLVSVLIPCYNAEKYIKESILSILNQTYTNLEIIAINDCSTDSTLEKLEDLAKADNRIKIFSNNENLRLIKTLNKGVELCSGKYIARMDADDISLSTRIEKEVRFLEENPDYDIVSTQFHTFHENDTNKLYPYANPCKFEDIRAFVLFKSCVCHPAVMIRKTLFTDLKLKFEEKYLHVEDYALWSKAVYLTKIANIDESLLLYRVHKTQISTVHEQIQLDNKKEVFKIHCHHWGLDDTDNLLDIYASVAESVPQEPTLEYLSKCEGFMINLLEINKVKKLCSQSFLDKMLSLHWLRLCANSRLGLKVYRHCTSSLLYKKTNYTYRDYTIFFVKCLFKIEYKKSVLYRLIFR